MKTSFRPWAFPLAVFYTLVSISTHLVAQSPAIQVREFAGESTEDPLDIPKGIQLGWEFRADTQTQWEPVQIGLPFESHQGVGFDGVGWYRKQLTRLDQSAHGAMAKRLVLRFNGAATHAKVWCDGVLIAEHLGGWTPFECDLTDFIIPALAKAPSEKAPRGPASDRCELLVRVDEMPGHNSQGFLPVFAPHFGGLWQPIEAAWVHPVRIDTRELFVWGDLTKSELVYEIPLVGLDKPSLEDLVRDSQGFRVCLRYRLAPGNSDIEPNWNEHWIELNEAQLEALCREQSLTLKGQLVVPGPVAWSPAAPALYDLQIGLRKVATEDNPPVEDWLDWVETYAAFREVRTEGPKLLLNGQELGVRGVLNWGYAPPSVAPSLDPEHWRSELQLVKDHGFNLMKFCLWIPPKGYLEMADRMGVLVWMEYPTWHSQWTKESLPALEREFDEFFCYDRNHPSVVLRSLTCETGPSADIEVIRKLYDRCHLRIPGSIVEDDSSWIQWNRVHDFYDDHPYGNNHTWVPTLARLRRYIDEHGVKPLVLGEAIAADTWLPPGSLDSIAPRGQQARLQGVPRGKDPRQIIEPFWFPLSYRANSQWAQSRQKDMGHDSVAQLESDSKRYAWLMRKYQIETFRRELPDAGYVVSVIRDFPFAAMGLIDFRGEPKWSREDWDWHGERLLMLKTDQDRRSFWADEPFEATLLIDRSKGLKQRDLSLRWRWESDSVSRVHEHKIEWLDAKPDAACKLMDLRQMVDWEKSQSPVGPVRWKLVVELLDRSGPAGERLVCRNQWDLWQIPPRGDSCKGEGADRAASPLRLHGSCSAEMTNRLRGLARRTGRRILETGSFEESKGAGRPVWIAQRLDTDLLDRIEQGERVLMVPDGQKGSLPTSEHWFLRGGPIVSAEPRWDRLRRLIVDLQHFDLAGPVVPDVHWLAEAKPLIMLWDNHDIAQVKTHGLLFASRLGNGLMVVDCLNHGDGTGAAGAMLFEEVLSWLESVAGGSVEPMHSETLLGLRNKLREQTMSLVEQPWEFRPDPDGTGIEQGWHRLALDESQKSQWKPIAIGRHWESVGYPSLDGWAWYRTEVTVPEGWPEGELYLQVDGADDYIEVYVQGELVGTAGDRQARRTAFEERRSFAIPKGARPGERLSISIRVEDWQGAGGLFRPIRLSTTELQGASSILR